MAVVTPTDCPKSVCNRCVIEVFNGVFCVVTLRLGFSVGVRAFVIGLSRSLPFFLACCDSRQYVGHYLHTMDNFTWNYIK